MGYVSQVCGEFFAFRSTTQIKNLKHQCPFFDEEILSFKRMKNVNIQSRKHLY